MRGGPHSQKKVTASPVGLPQATGAGKNWGEFSMSYEADWKAAKKQFENATGKKKPSEKFLGVFRESSGIEGACKKLDQSLADPSEENVTKATAAFDKAMMAYMTTL